MREMFVAGIIVCGVACTFKGASSEMSDVDIADGSVADSNVTDSGTDINSQISCDPLANPVGANVQLVENDTALQDALDNLNDGDVIELAKNTYTIPLTIDVPNIQLRSQSGIRGDVHLKVNSGPVITVTADNVTIFAVTIESREDGIVVDTSSNDITKTRIHDVQFIDNGRAAVSLHGGNHVVDTLISCSDFLITNRDDLLVCDASTIGIKAKGATRLRITRNRFENYSCDLPKQDWTRSIEVGGQSVDTVVDRNLFLHPKVAVLLGEDKSGSLPCNTASTAHLRGLACNNVVWDLEGGTNSVGEPYFDSGFLSWAACESLLVHNTVFSVSTIGASATEGRFLNSSTVSANNLSNLPHRSRNGGLLAEKTNTTGAMETTFVAATQNPPDLSLRAATAPGTDLSSYPKVKEFCSVDFNGVDRLWSAPTQGAFEFRNN